MKEMCEVTAFHEEAVAAVRGQLPELGGMAEIFKALADETRLKIAYSLMVGGKLCVCDVSAIIGSSTATASHHLRYLKQHGLASSEREGKLVFYFLKDDHVRDLVKIAQDHAEEGAGNGE
ncbi:ArsR/SmtB family transcription factor [Edaphobacillus lindanitolerans]|uniref:Cadmium-sensing regulator, CadC n=1 Tax=Edaphobacillus lindanitolerans TaxID=550447 RepID=A0A1U7PS25_9BACI|nr:metalloregulator ArsR/SmtB family transcription factor [Edaphobacillus lindanitolerans]SIT89369.1 cadmium-sensing regulator, CadC [Edaphobacillus lindanitolerans]